MIKYFKTFLILNMFLLATTTAYTKNSDKVSSVKLTSQEDATKAINTFAVEMANKYQFDKKEILQLLSSFKVRQDIIQKISKPAESLSWYRYRPIFIKNQRINQGVDFWKKHQETLQKAYQVYGVDPAIIVAIIGVETFYGKIQGSYPVIEALHTLGFYYPKRSKFFRQELEEFFLLAREQNWQLDQIKGSYAGAMGMGQFISSSYRHYAVDFNQDGKINLFSDPIDMIGSVANYFSRHHWTKGGFVTKKVVLNSNQENIVQSNLKLTHALEYFEELKIDIKDLKNKSKKVGILSFEVVQDQYEHWLVGDNFYVITRYNHSQLYALAVYQLSQAIKQKMQDKN